MNEIRRDDVTAGRGGAPVSAVGVPRRLRKRRDRYGSYTELAAHEREGSDYRVVVEPVVGSGVAIVAPHAGGIERGTSRIAAQLAGDDFSLYLFEGLKPHGNFDALHITSRRFDEPRCLELVSRSEVVVTVHGCVGLDERIYIGGLHDALKLTICESLGDAGFDARTAGHGFPAIDPDNLCNRGRSGRGVQLEFTGGFRCRMFYADATAVLRRALQQSVSVCGLRQSPADVPSCR